MCIQTVIDYGSKIALVVIAVVNLTLAFHSFLKKRKDDAAIKESDRRIDWLKSLILTPNLTKFYDFFDHLESNIGQLKTLNVRSLDDEKADIDSKNLDLFIKFRKEFMLLFSAVDENIYKQILDRSDKLQAALTTSIFDDTLDFGKDGIIESNLIQLISDSKRDILVILFSYRGNTTQIDRISIKDRFRKNASRICSILIIILVMIGFYFAGSYNSKNEIIMLEKELMQAKQSLLARSPSLPCISVPVLLRDSIARDSIKKRAIKAN